MSSYIVGFKASFEYIIRGSFFYVLGPSIVDGAFYYSWGFLLLLGISLVAGALHCSWGPLGLFKSGLNCINVGTGENLLKSEPKLSINENNYLRLAGQNH